MIGSDVWRKAERWVPIDATMRPWEQTFVKNGALTSREKHVHEDDQKMKELLEEKSIKEITKDISTTLPRRYSQSERISFPFFNSTIAPVFENLLHFWAMGPWNNGQGKRLKDAISRSWVRSSVRNDEEK